MTFRAWSFPPEFGEIEGRPLAGAESALAGSPDPGAEAGLQVPDLSPGQVASLVNLLRTQKAPALARMPVERILRAVDRVVRRFRDPMNPHRMEAAVAIRAQAGYSLPMANRVLDGMLRDWTRPRLEALLQAEFPDPGVLDGFRPGPVGGRVRARGCPLVFHLGAGSVPGVTATSMIRALLVKSASLVRPGRGDLALPVLLARSLREVDPEVGGALAVAYWPDPRGELTREALGAADLVVVYGGDDTLDWVRGKTPVTTPLRGYRHRLGVAMVGREAMKSEGLAGFTARAAAEAVALFDQRGCVSPHVFFVEGGGALDPEAWARLLAEALEDLESSLPSGPLSPEDGAALQQRRGQAEMEESLGRGFVLHGGSEGPWTVQFSDDRTLEVSCLNRVVRVVAVADLAEVPALLAPWRLHLQTVGVAGAGEGRGALLEALAELGVSRITPLEGVPWPPAWWHHDGAGPLRALVRWTDLEFSEE